MGKLKRQYPTIVHKRGGYAEYKRNDQTPSHEPHGFWQENGAEYCACGWPVKRRVAISKKA